MDVFVAGGTGFVGRRLCRELARRGHDVTAASRSPSGIDLPDAVETVAVDVALPHNAGSDAIGDAVAGHDAVVNLVALPSHRTPREGTHESVHLGGTRALLEAAEATDVERFVQVSALGADGDVDTAYFRAKRRAEALVRESALDWIVYRPSVVFGEGCAFFRFLRRMIPPVVAPLPGGGRLQLHPIWVGDLVAMLADGLEDDSHVGNTYDLSGPEPLAFHEIVRAVCGTRYVIPVPMPVARVGFALAERVPFVPLDRDQYRVFGEDNVAEPNDVTAFGREPADLRTLGDYLDSQA